MPCALQVARVQRQREELEAEVGVEADQDARIGDAQAGAPAAVEVGQAAIVVGARVGRLARP